MDSYFLAPRSNFHTPCSEVQTPRSGGHSRRNFLILRPKRAQKGPPALRDHRRGGYAPLPDYDEPAFLISKVVTYRVKDEFPRLTRPHLPTGVTKVAYDIRLDALEPHECDGEAVFGEN